MHSFAPLLRCPAPAKLNLFLHVIGQRTDGYHLLQTVFQLVDWCDYLDFYCRQDGAIRRINTLDKISAEEDLSLRAAKLLQAYTGCHLGVDIYLEKHLPLGGGVGGGSSDAATTLLALNRLWNLHLTRTELISLGQQLGADVPFFIFGRNAFAQGIGEQLEAIDLPKQWFTVLCPASRISTAGVFSDPNLTRTTEPVRIADFTAYPDPFQYGRNDLQAIIEKRDKAVANAITWLARRVSNTRMTGSGACVFASFSTCSAAQKVVSDAQQENWPSHCISGLKEHPLIDFAM